MAIAKLEHITIKVHLGNTPLIEVEGRTKSGTTPHALRLADDATALLTQLCSKLTGAYPNGGSITVKVVNNNIRPD